MSKQAGNNVAKSGAKGAGVTGTQLAEAMKQAEKPVETTTKQPDTNVADVKLNNDAFACYDSVDVDKLTDDAVDAYKQGERSSRREGQMQIANILARYHQDKLLGDASPSKLYVLDGKVMKLQVKTVQAIARIVYKEPEKTLAGAKNPLPRHLEMRIRNIAPIVFYAIQERIPLVWDADKDALMVPMWYATTDKELVEKYEKEPQLRAFFSEPKPLDGRDGKTVANLLKRTPDPSKQGRGTNGNNGQTKEQAKEQAFQNAAKERGLAKLLETVSEMFTRAEQKPFSDEIVELLAVCCEHVNVRNGDDALGKAVATMKAPAEKPKQKSAA